MLGCLPAARGVLRWRRVLLALASRSGPGRAAPRGWCHEGCPPSRIRRPESTPADATWHSTSRGRGFECAVPGVHRRRSIHPSVGGRGGPLLDLAAGRCQPERSRPTSRQHPILRPVRGRFDHIGVAGRHGSGCRCGSAPRCRHRRRNAAHPCPSLSSGGAAEGAGVRL